jgi:hypothetical protein
VPATTTPATKAASSWATTHPELFGNGFDATIDHVHFDQTGAYLPHGADADDDGLKDAWEFQYFGSITGAVATNDEDGDGRNNLQEQGGGTDPWTVNSAPRTLKLFVLTGESNALGVPGTTDTTMRLPAVGTHPAEMPGGVPFFWDNRADGTPSRGCRAGGFRRWMGASRRTDRRSFCRK